MKNKTIKITIALITIGVLSSCTRIPIDEETTGGIGWWQTAIFFFLWLFFSCPMITKLIMDFSGNEYSDGSDEDKELKYSLAGASVYAFPIMYVLSLIIGMSYEWYVSYIISIIIGFIIGYRIRAKVNPLCDAYIDKTKWLWIAQGVLTVLSIILAVTN